MSRAVLSLGSNMGDRTAHLQGAVAALGAAVRAVSSIYRTPPWGGVEQDDFYNIVVIADDGKVDDATLVVGPLPGSWSRPPGGSAWSAGGRARWTPTSSRSRCTAIRCAATIRN